MPDFIARYAKAFTALVGTASTALVAALQDGSISWADWIAIALAIATPVTVSAVSNRPDRIKPSVHDVE